MKPTEKDIQETKQKFSEDVYLCEASKLHTVLVRRPNEDAVHAVFDAGQSRSMPMYRLARSVVVWPEIAEWDNIAKQYPALPMVVGAFALNLAAADEAAEAKKA